VQHFFNRLTRSCRCFPGFCLFSLACSAQVGLPDSAGTPGSSTLVKIRPVSIVLGALNLALEQTLGPRSSVQVEAYHTVANGRFVRVLGRARSLSASFRYYPLARQTAPRGLYVGPKLSFSRLGNSSLLRLITLFDATGDVAATSVQAVVGYQFVFRRNLVLEAHTDVGLLHHLTYQRGGPSGPPTTERRTKLGLTVPGLTVGVGYRFRHRRSQQAG